MHFKNKFLALTLLVLFLSNTGYSQIYGKVEQIKPTGLFGFVAQKTIGIEVGYLQEFDSQFRGRIYLNLASYKARMDTFPGKGYSNLDGDYKFYPGTEVYSKLINGIFGVGYDFSPDFFDDFLIKPYIGLDLNIGVHIQESHTHIPGIVSSGRSGDGAIFGVKGRFGMQYSFGNSGLFIDLTRTYTVIVPYAFINFNAYGIGFFHNF